MQKQKFEVTSKNEKESNKINLFAALLLSSSSSLTISKIRKKEALGTRLQQNYCYKTSKHVIQSMLPNRRNQFQCQCCNNLSRHNQFHYTGDGTFCFTHHTQSINFHHHNLLLIIRYKIDIAIPHHHLLPLPDYHQLHPNFFP